METELYTEQEGIEIVYQLIKKLQDDGFMISRDNISNIIFIDSTDECGHMLFTDKTTYSIFLNKKLLKKNKLNYLMCVAYHELAHIIQYNEAIANHIIEYNKDIDSIEIVCKDILLADYLIFDNYHHTKLWLEIVEKINSKYIVVPKITAYLSQEELNKFLEEFFMDVRIRPNEPHIDRTISGLTIEDMMRYNVKPEYLKTTINESYKINHDYRKLLNTEFDKHKQENK